MKLSHQINTVMEGNTYYPNNKGSYSEFCEEIQEYLPKAYKILLNGLPVDKIESLYNLSSDATISIYMDNRLIIIYYNHTQQIIYVEYP